ncbi:hypothetical protein [Cytobacillus oceanisediminis]|uniref:hypothetical protein n=1 Tax=Cytobacillus oceanisediminis TaxID=665099 RepID=UPI0011A25F13|nr:hypothetical protein [Cytobacillus oceanisediminis]
MENQLSIEMRKDFRIIILQFQILRLNQSLKNNTGRKIEKNQEVSILETSAFDENHDQILSVSGYLPMEDNKQYMLFLEPNDSEKGPAVGSFNIQGVVMGKFAFEKDNNERHRLEDRETKHYEKVHSRAHKKMIGELNEKYGDYLED